MAKVKRSGKKKIKKKSRWDRRTYSRVLTTPSLHHRPPGKCDILGERGSCRIKGFEKEYPVCCANLLRRMRRKGKENGMMTVDVYIKGPGAAREAALRALQIGARTHPIKDITLSPIMVCRPPKRR